MALIFKMDLVWWINFFVQYALPVFGFIIVTCIIVLIISTISERRSKLYEK